MPKIKTRKAAAKRIRVTGSGKLMARHTKIGHLRRKKSSRKWRRLKLEREITGGLRKSAQRMIPNS